MRFVLLGTVAFDRARSGRAGSRPRAAAELLVLKLERSSRR
ncbi:hypothetical protein AKJ09_02736 [Labilithrix luteola]|uniref:Uncharacterized protein n=1 Tax=Labilithrix luteola TaxID=1391654 RepID=A0A0K1PRC5_9BACT|nr:hypothetical protein AKJ09_02736 [Labilithrix luteola]